MFTGIIEAQATVVNISPQGSGIEFTMDCSMLAGVLKVDQSLSHNGVCLTVTSINDKCYTVTAVEETLKKTNFSKLKTGDLVNLERSMPVNGRFDGHLVQGHVDETATCVDVSDKEGSWEFLFSHAPSENITVKKGSICVNGVSLTVVDSGYEDFSVAVIPYTYAHTNFKYLQKGDLVNLEFDIVGKYLAKLNAMYNRN